MPKSELRAHARDLTLRSVLDEEINRLPVRYRAPLVLCCLGGKTSKQAARLLGWSPRAVAWRLAQGEETLRRRLQRRGVALGPLLLAPLLEPHAADMPMPSSLVHSTVRAAGMVARTGAMAGAVAVPVETLAEATLRALALSRLAKVGGMAAGVLLFLILLFGSAYLVAGSDGPLPIDRVTDHCHD